MRVVAARSRILQFAYNNRIPREFRVKPALYSGDMRSIPAMNDGSPHAGKRNVRGVKATAWLLGAVGLCANALAQSEPASPPSPPSQDDQTTPERWNLFYQATSIGQYHG